MKSQAPGKIILIGEYAVLEGAPALVAAVDRYAGVETREGGAPQPTLTVHAPEIGVQRAVLTRPQLTGDAEKPLALVLSRLRALPATIQEVTLDTQAFFDGTDKLGLGSSAALTVALERLLDPHGSTDAIFERAYQAHRDFQKGAGSGIDLAASVHGGVLRYRLRGADLPERTPLKWPKDLAMIAIWSGASADTRRFLVDVAGFAGREPSSYAGIMSALTRTSEQGCAAFAAGDVEGFLAAAAAYGEGLANLGKAAGVAIETPEHARIGAIARSSGARYKPAGAGGGDLGVALCRQGDAPAVQDALKNAGLRIVPVAVSSTGALTL
jgi:phosphomevalonate kinase